jgi:hypothetical protein
MKINKVKIAELKQAEYNPRQITKRQYEDLKKSLEKFGLVDPIIINSDNTVIGGHQRLRIVTELGATEVPTVRLNLSKEDERELNIRLNKNTGEFNLDLLANHFDMEELKDWGFKDIEFGLNIDKINATDEWVGMPEFANEDLTPNRQLIISFKNDKDIKDFAELIGQKVTEKTKSLWFPEVEDTKQFDKTYE